MADEPGGLRDALEDAGRRLRTSGVSGCESEVRVNMIHRVTTDTSREATLRRVEAVCEATYHALLHGLQVADNLHKTAGWNQDADIHLYRQMTRREAMEDLKQLGPSLEEDDNLGLAMSGLILDLPDDTLRVWHTTDSDVPTPRSATGRDFVTQSFQRPALFVVGGLAYDGKAKKERNSLIVQWTAQGTKVLRFDLVRPCGYLGGKVEIDWRMPLLSSYQTMPDVTYRRRDRGTGSNEEAGET